MKKQILFWLALVSIGVNAAPLIDQGLSNDERTAVTTVVDAPVNEVLLGTSQGVAGAGITRDDTNNMFDADMPVRTPAKTMVDFNAFEAAGNVFNGPLDVRIRTMGSDRVGALGGSLFDDTGSEGFSYPKFGPALNLPALAGISQPRTGSPYVDFNFINPKADGVTVLVDGGGIVGDDYSLHNTSPSESFTGCQYAYWVTPKGQTTPPDYANVDPRFSWKQSDGGTGFNLSTGLNANIPVPSPLGFPVDVRIWNRISCDSGNVQIGGENVVFPPAGHADSETTWLPSFARGGVQFATKQFVQDKLPTPSANKSLFVVDTDDSIETWSLVGGENTTVVVDDSANTFTINSTGSGTGSTDAADITVSDTDLTGVLTGSGNVQEALKRLDNTGVGASPREITTNGFTATYGTNGNQNIWYGGRQFVTIRVRPSSSANYTFELPGITELGLMFDDQVTRGLGETYTLRVEYLGGSTQSVVRNSLTIEPANVSPLFNRNELPTTIAQGAAVTFYIDRVGGVLGQWVRLGVEQAGDPIATFGEVVLQNRGWNNADSSLLPSGDAVQKGYAFPVFGSNPNDGTLRAGLEAAVGERVIYDGDYVIWTADAFTSWLDGDNWFVINRESLQRISREASNFLLQVSENDQRVDTGRVNQQFATNALVWISESPFTSAPFISPSNPSDTNPRPGDDYRYVGGTDQQNSDNDFQFGQNRFNSYLTVGVSPSHLQGNPVASIDVLFFDEGIGVFQRLNLANDFTENTGFTNSSYRYFQRSTTVNYPALASIMVVQTETKDHYTLNPLTVDVTQNIPLNAISEPLLGPDVREKLNRALPEQGVSYASIAERLMQYRDQVRMEPDVNAQFLSSDPTDPYPSDLSGFTGVSPENPRYQATATVLFIATPGSEGNSHVLTNTTTDTPQVLDQSQLIESVTSSGVSYFIYRVTGIVSGNRYEVSRIINERVVAERTDIANNQNEIERIEATLSHAVLNLPDEVVEILQNDVTVTKQSNAVETPSLYNLSLSNDGTQAVFKETSPGASTPGVKVSEPYNALTEAGKKLVYFNADQVYMIGQGVISASDGATTRDLIRFGGNDVFNARVRVPAIPASTRTVTLYPCPKNKVCREGAWQPIPTLTFINGVPEPEADELFFLRDLPTSPVTLDVMYRSLANQNEFVNSSFTLAGVGGSSEVATSVTFNDGSESATLEIRYYPNFNGGGRAIRASVTEQVYQGLPTINDVEVILSYTETRTVPGTNASTRDVPIESLSNRGQVFAFVQNSDGTLSVIGDNAHVNLGWQTSVLFGATGVGTFIAGSETASFFNYQRLDLSQSGVRDLENHIDLPQFGLFTTNYTNETDLNIDVTIKPSGFNVNDLPTSATGLSSGDVWFNGSLQFIP